MRFQIPWLRGVAKYHPSQPPSNFHVHGLSMKSGRSLGRPSRKRKVDTLQTKAKLPLWGTSSYHVLYFRGPASCLGKIQGPIQKARKSYFPLVFVFSLRGQRDEWPEYAMWAMPQASLLLSDLTGAVRSCSRLPPANRRAAGRAAHFAFASFAALGFTVSRKGCIRFSRTAVFEFAFAF